MSDYRPSESSDADVQMPLGMITGDPSADPASGFDPSFSEKKPSLTGSMLLVILLIAAAGVLLAMRMTSAPPRPDSAVTQAEQKIDEALLKLAGNAKSSKSSDPIQSLLRDTDAVVAVFANDPSQRQVAVEHLQKNPFQLIITRKAATGSDPAAASVDQAKVQRQRKLKEELAKLSLQSVLLGATPVAIISGKVVREGQTVGPFTIEQIGSFGVRLRADADAFTLAMNQPATNPNPKSP